MRRIGIDFGGTNLRVGCIEQQWVTNEYRVRTDFTEFCATHTPEEALQHIVTVVAEALQSIYRQYDDITAIGIGFPGFIDPQTRRVIQSPNLPGLDDFDLVGRLRDRLGCVVGIENDALAAAYGEHLRLKVDSLVYLGLGTGVGGGLVLQGRPVRGDHGVAMEVGHIIVEPGGRLCGCGQHGCLEQYASTLGVMNTYRAATGITANSVEIAAYARQGDSQASGAYQLAGVSLARALAHITKIVDVRHVVIGGGLGGAWTLLCETFYSTLESELIPALRGRVQIVAGDPDDQAGMVGAALLAGT